jgi:tetratricopeptide (TPR) repeat protein
VNILTGTESTELFGGEVSPAVRHLVEMARNAPREQAAAALWTAALSSPQSLPVYYLLYKLHAGLGKLDEALQAARKGLAAAAQAAALPPDWRAVQPGDADFSAPGPAHFWLFTLKALAFIHLRRGEREAAQGFVAQLRRLDPADHLGTSVVQALLHESA